MAGPYRRIVRKVGPEGGELQTAYCTIIVPPGAVTMETEITCQVINPSDVTLPLKEGEMLVSDVIELSPPGTTFHQPVTVQMQYSSVSLGGAREAVMWVTEDRSQWTELKTTGLSENKLSVSVDHFSIFAVVSQLKQDQFTVPTEGFKLTSSTQTEVQISFPKQAVTTPTQVTIQVQEVPKRAVENMKAKDQTEYSRGVVSTSPIVTMETGSDKEVQFKKPPIVRVPHPKRYMATQHEGDTKLKVMSYDKEKEDWKDETEHSNVKESDKSVEFEANHCTKWIVIVVENIIGGSEEITFPSTFCQWLECSEVQFLLMRRKGNAKEFVIECALEKDAERRHTELFQRGYEGPLPSNSVDLLEGQVVDISLQGYVSIAPFNPKPQITFHSQKPKRSRCQIQVLALEAKGQNSGRGSTSFFALPRFKVDKNKIEEKARAFVHKGPDKLGQPHSEEQPKYLCQLPIHVPYETPKLIEDAGASIGGVEKYFYFVKEEVSTDWGDLAFHLGFKWADIANIAGRNPDDKSRCMDMLHEWKKREGDAATMEVLMEALSDTGLQSVVDGLKSKYPDIVASE